MSKQWGHGFHNGFAGRTAESQRMIAEYGLKPRDGETAQEILARETGYAEGWCDAIVDLSPWQHFWARRALLKRSNEPAKGRAESASSD